MPKATLEFNLPEESCEHDMAVNGWKYQLVLQELDSEIRNYLKHDAGPLANAPEAMRHGILLATEHWRTRLHSLAEERGVEVW